MAQTILVVDDDELIRRSVAYHLERAGYRVQTARTAEAALDIAQEIRPDLVLLDINMPGMDGLAALPPLRDKLNIPVIFVTARRREFDEVLGLELGASDYVTKPFDKDVLLARVRATLRSAGQAEPLSPTAEEPLKVGDLIIDPTTHVVSVGDRSINLSPREYKLLKMLAQQRARVVSYDEILDRVWGPEFAGQLQVIYVHIRWLREKIEANPQKPKRILTVRSVGYRLVAPET